VILNFLFGREGLNGCAPPLDAVGGKNLEDLP
jgi:hypothetical protein